VVIVPGYYATFSGASDRHALKTLAEDMSNEPEFLIPLNNFVQVLPFSDVIGAGEALIALLEDRGVRVG
jgi:hypothetical protein